MTKNTENPSDCVSQKPKAKSKMVVRIVKLVRAEGLTYDDWRYVSRRVRQLCELQPAKKPKKLPRVLTADEFRRFYQIVDRAEDVQHALMLRLVFYTGVRVGELCRIEVAEIDLENCKIFINQGKGSKDRYVLFGKTFATALRTHIAAHPNNRWLFQTRRNSKFTPRRVQGMVVGGMPQTFWVVTKPTANSELGDICFECDFKRFALQVRGGLDVDDISAIFADEQLAKLNATKMIAAQRRLP